MLHDKLSQFRLLNDTSCVHVVAASQPRTARSTDNQTRATRKSPHLASSFLNWATDITFTDASLNAGAGAEDAPAAGAAMGTSSGCSRRGATAGAGAVTGVGAGALAREAGEGETPRRAVTDAALGMAGGPNGFEDTLAGMEARDATAGIEA
jgi:hypothetical protein